MALVAKIIIMQGPKEWTLKLKWSETDIRNNELCISKDNSSISIHIFTEAPRRHLSLVAFPNVHTVMLYYGNCTSFLECKSKHFFIREGSHLKIALLWYKTFSFTSERVISLTVNRACFLNCIPFARYWKLHHFLPSSSGDWWSDFTFV